MLGFEEQIVSELMEDPGGGIVIISSGLRLHSLIAALITLHHPSKGSLLILSASDALKSSIPSAADIPGDILSHHRSALYASGAAFFVTPRVLIADLLTARVPPASISSLLIPNAHRVSDTSPEAFVVRVLRAGNPSAAVLAFSDRPHAMAAGFAKAERTMKCLLVRRLHLWPRFHVLVSADLERDPPEVVDIRVPMTAAMKGIQDAVLEAMGACLKELRRTNKVDVEDLTVENGLFKSFDEIVRRQLDPIWHTLGKKTKQLVSDLKTLRKLLDYLVRYDAVTYLKYLDTLRVSEGVRSVWIFADSSHKIFEYAKRRVYHVVVTTEGGREDRDGGCTSNKKRRLADNKNKGKIQEGETSLSKSVISTSSGFVLEEVLEEAPKWKVLRELLEEIEEERQKQFSTEGELGNSGSGKGSDFVLVACKDELSCLQLENSTMKSSYQVMRDEWEKYLLGKVELHNLRKRNRKKSQDPKGIGVLDGAVAPCSSENVQPSSISRIENDALLAAASGISSMDKEEIVVCNYSRAHGTRRAAAKRGGKRTGKSPRKPQIRNKSKKPVTNGEPLETRAEVKVEEDNMTVSGSVDNFPKITTMISDDGDGLKNSMDSDQYIHTKPLPPVQFYALDREQHILDIWKPSVIIVYHPDMAFVREIEIYKAQNPSKNLRVYFLFYEDSTEAQKFEASIRRENGAFESLIRQKSLMMIPADQDGLYTGSAASSESHSLLSQNSQTRKAGGRKQLEKETQVIVDMREFMSSLPNVLHQKGMRIIPVVLEVGDYILSPLICVERKSIIDLFQSFASGRLFNQVETMVRYYRMPVLLIEFSQDKSFSLQSANDIGDDVSRTSIISKLCLLVLHFPRLRLVWSRSVHATAEIFSSLKANQDEPDESKAVRVGVPSEDGIVENDVRAENYNTSAIEFLRRLPGVTDLNYRALMDGCKNLAELALLPVERLAELMGGQKSARMLKEFLDAKFPSLL